MQYRNWSLSIVSVILLSCGGESTVSPVSTPNSEVSKPTELLSCAQGGICVIGDAGPGGGIIVYVDVDGFSSCDDSDRCLNVHCHLFNQDKCHYLEAAPEDLPGVYNFWQAPLEASTYATPTADDWQLPSVGALLRMCDYATQLYLAFLPDTGEEWNECDDSDFQNDFSSLIGGFQPDWYWSSSHLYGLDYPEYDAWSVHFGSGNASGEGMYFRFRIRPVRAF